MRRATGRLWVYARDDRPWNGPEPPAAVYLYSPDSKAERPASHLAGFSAIVQVDGYPGFDRLSRGGRIQLAGCWAHAIRKFYEVQQATGSPVAAEAPRRIAEPYALENAIRGRAADARQGVQPSRYLWSRHCYSSNSPELRGSYFTIVRRPGGGAAACGAADEIENVSHVFQPAGRFSAANSPYPFRLR